MAFRVPFVLITLIVLLCSSAPAFTSIDLVFGVYASNKPTAMIAKFKPVMNVLETELSQSLGDKVNIRLKIANSYEEGRQQLVKGEVDFSRFGSASYVIAKEQQPGISILASESKKGKHSFNGVIVIKDDSNLTSVEQLKGKSFAFGNKTSTIGRYLSQLYLLKNDIFAKDLASYKYLGRHDKVGTMVAAGRYDAGAMNEKTYDKLIKKGKKLKVLATFSCPTKPWLARAGLSEKVKKALITALLNFEDKKALKKLKYQGFLSSKDSHFNEVRTAIKQNSDFFK